MTHQPYHPHRTPDGKCKRKDGGDDGRSDKQKGRDYPYYLRLNEEWFYRLQQMLDVPVNRERGTAIRSCPNRADLIETAFGSFLRLDAVARQLKLNGDLDAFVTRLLEGHDYLIGRATRPVWVNREPPAANDPTSSPKAY